MYADMDPQRLRGLARGSLSAKDGQTIGNDGSIGSPMQSTSSKVLLVFFHCLSFLMKWENWHHRAYLNVSLIKSFFAMNEFVVFGGWLHHASGLALICYK